jgi:hypothetical protein
VRIAIMQPTYLPWVGYFDLMDQVDQFILLDDAQFVKQSWQQRNRIKTPEGLQWLSLPIFLRGRFGQKLNEVEIREPEFWRKHLKTVETNYRRSQFFPKYYEGLLRCFEAGSPWQRLIDVNVNLITWLAPELDVTTPLIRASTLAVEGVRSERLAALCEVMGAAAYVSPIGSAEYLLDDLAEFREHRIDLTFQHYDHPAHRQLFGPFCPFASAIDLLFNEGPAAGQIMRSGRRPAFTVDEVRATARPNEMQSDSNT